MGWRILQTKSHRLPCPHTHAQKGKIERCHDHIVETSLALLAHAFVPKKYWHFAFETTVYLVNRKPSPVSNHLSPYEFLFNKWPDYNFL